MSFVMLDDLGSTARVAGDVRRLTDTLRSGTIQL